MTDYGLRRASLIRAELARRGEDEHDLARAIGVVPRTGERWVSTGAIQRKHRKHVADYLGIPFDTLFPEDVLEERLQLDRIESQLEAIQTTLSEFAAQLRDALQMPAPKTRKPASKSQSRRAK